MKAALVLTIAGLAAAQFAGEPSCAVPCLASAVPAAGCQLTDLECQCVTKFGTIAGLVAGCLTTNCDSADLITAQQVGEAICSSFLAAQSSTSAPASTSTSAPSTSTTSSSAAASVTTSSTSASASASGTVSSNVTTSPTPSPTGVTVSGANVVVVTAASLFAGLLALVAAL